MSEPAGRAGVSGRRLSSPKAARWALGIAVATMVAMGLVLLFLLTQATNNRELYERNYARLFVLNMVIAGLLLAVIAWVAFRLLQRLRRGKFGSRLLVKLAAVFALVGFVPGLLIYVVSYQFVSRSIESWFDVKVEGALDAGLSLGRATLDTLSSDLANKTRLAVPQVADASEATMGLALERLRDQLSASEVVLWSAAGQPVASAGQTGRTRFELAVERPSVQQLRLARSQRVWTQVEGFDEPAPGASSGARIKALALVTSSNLGLLDEPRFLQVTLALPTTLVDNAAAVQEANREYQERALARQGLRRMYIGTLTLSLFLAVFGAILLAVLLGNQLVRPLLVLAEGVRQVAEGNLSPKMALSGRDELGGLTRSFAQMTQQLAEARAAVEKSMGEVSAARANLQTILDNLTAGVIVLDASGHVLSANPGATRILRVPLAAHTHALLGSLPGLAPFAEAVQARFEEFLGDSGQHGFDHWQQSFELHPVGGMGETSAVTVLARGAELPGAARLLVFDDVSDIVSAQRAQAWAEVARRLAHEIKNPLTPIQLSAERLEMKLMAKLNVPEQAVLVKSVKTIVDQVDAMKRLVNEFRDYARLPAADLKRLDLNELVADVLQLYGGGGAQVPVRQELDPLCPPVRADAQQLRQVLHNLLQNAQDASELHATDSKREVVVSTRWNEATQRVRLRVQDSGPGFPEHILKRAFEPYVTTKTKGTGLGLAVVKKIADEHGARIDLTNRLADGAVLGAQVSLSFAADAGA